MKLVDYCNKYYESRAKCAEALGISTQHLNNMVSNKTNVVQLISGEWMILTAYNKTFKQL